MTTEQSAAPRYGAVTTAIGLVQILAWGSSYYLLAVLAGAIVADMGWSLPWVMGAVSAALGCAALCSPVAGRLIARYGGRPVLTTGCLLLSAGLLVAAAAPSLPVFYAGWCLAGLGMAGALYDAAFASLGRLFRGNARRAITIVTLWGGFASTVCWPLSGWLLAQYGWRGTMLAYAGMHLLISLPLLLRCLPREVPLPPAPGASQSGGARLSGTERRAYRLMTGILVMSGLAVGMISMHLLTLLQAQGYPLATAVAIGAMFGPAQVAGRLVEMAGRGRHHPIWSLLFATGSVACGLLLLALDLTWPGLAMVIYGAGNGVFSIARGALPLVLFGPGLYPELMGRLARPGLLAQAASPLLGGLVISLMGPAATLSLTVALALTSLSLTLLLWRICRR